MKLLIVEDQEAIRKLLAEMLSQEGYEVAIRPNGASATQLLDADRELDLAILDWVLPDLPGEEMLRRVMEHPAHLRCLVISGYELYLGDFPEAWHPRLGFLEKPFTPAMLRSALASLLI